MSDYPPILDLWNFSDLDLSENKFREWISKIPESDPYHWELLTQLARTFSLRRNFEQAHSILDTVETHISQSTAIHVRYLLERGRSFNSNRQADLALPLFKIAYELATQAQLDYLAIDAGHMVAIAMPETASQIKWHQKCLSYAEKSHQADAKKWLGAIYNNLGWTYHDMREYEKALEIFQQGLAWRESQGKIASIRIAKYTVARTLRSLERYEEALDYLTTLSDDLQSTDDEDGFVSEELGECLLALNRADEAKHHFQAAYRLLKDISWVEKERLERIRQLAQ